MKKYLMFLLLISFGLAAYAQDENPPIATDRPDQSESSLSVPHKTLQIESGFSYGWDEEHAVSISDISYNSSLFRYGVYPRLEVRLGIGIAGHKENIELMEEEISQRGLVPLVVGFKWNFLYGNGPIPTMAILSDVSIPKAASDDFNDGNVAHNIKLIGSWTLSKVFSLGINVGSSIDWEQYDATGLYTASLSMSILSWMGAFVELYGFVPTGEYPDHRFDLGFTFPIKNNLQFDISGGVGLSKNSPDGFGAFGFAWRIPK